MRKGFTLIELLVVIAIIAILAAILFPVLAQARNKAQQNDCLSNVKQIQLSLIMYATDNDDTGPLELQGAPYPANYDMQWPSEVLPYIRNLQIFLCPSDPAPFALAAGNTVPVASYGRNDYFDTNGTGLPEADIAYSAEMFSIMDAIDQDVEWDVTLAQARQDITPNGTASTCRHNQGCNVGYLDGHAKWLPLSAIPDPAGGNPPAASPARHFWLGVD
jgi:prepilin-type N-terminal cleavage/methylation domain-containing protein/prepilin-type processing-associated H-X9-DG protein